MQLHFLLPSKSMNAFIDMHHDRADSFSIFISFLAKYNCFKN